MKQRQATVDSQEQKTDAPRSVFGLDETFATFVLFVTFELVAVVTHTRPLMWLAIAIVFAAFAKLRKHGSLWWLYVATAVIIAVALWFFAPAGVSGSFELVSVD